MGGTRRDLGKFCVGAGVSMTRATKPTRQVGAQGTMATGIEAQHHAPAGRGVPPYRKNATEVGGAGPGHRRVRSRVGAGWNFARSPGLRKFSRWVARGNATGKPS